MYWDAELLSYLLIGIGLLVIILIGLMNQVLGVLRDIRDEARAARGWTPPPPPWGPTPPQQR